MSSKPWDEITYPYPNCNGWQHQCYSLNLLRPRQNGRLFSDDTFKRIFLNKNIRISIRISLKFFPKGLINNIPALFLIMAWRRPGDKPLSEPMMVRSLTHMCVTRPQWVKCVYRCKYGCVWMIGATWSLHVVVSKQMYQVWHGRLEQ